MSNSEELIMPSTRSMVADMPKVTSICGRMRM